MTSEYLRVAIVISDVEPHGLIHNSFWMQKVVIMNHLSHNGRLEDVSDGLPAIYCVVSGLFASSYGFSAALRQ